MSLKFCVVACCATVSVFRADWLADVPATCVHGRRRVSRRVEAANVVVLRVLRVLRSIASVSPGSDTVYGRARRHRRVGLVETSSG